MSWIGRLFGTEKAISDLTDKDNGLLKSFGGWIDDFNYTDEEKADANTAKREWGIAQLNALAPFKVVQRILAVAAAALWIFLAINIVAAFWVEAYANRTLTTSTSTVDGVTTITTSHLDLVGPMLKFALSDYVFWPVVVVYALYFSGGVIESIKNKLGVGK